MHLGLAYFTPQKPELGVSRHLWFVLSDPAKSDRVVLANVSTKKCPSGGVCKVARGEHPAVSEDSYLRFREVRVASASQLTELIKKGLVQQTKDASVELARRLQYAILASPAVKLEAQEILKAQGVSLPELPDVIPIPDPGEGEDES